MTEYAHLRWMCRRGMLELDLWLNSVLENKYADFSKAQKDCFVRMLKEPDPLLMDWLLDKAQPDDAEFVALLDLIRAPS